MKPRMPYSPPAVPTIATSRTTSGASVSVSPIAGAAILRPHTSSPVALLSANNRPSSETEITLSFHSAMPRLLTPQQATSEAQALLVSGSNFQRVFARFPVDTSSAQTTPQPLGTYMMPSSTIGVASRLPDLFLVPAP